MTQLKLPQLLKKRKDFIFGVATSSFQIEGGREARLDCIWDTFCDKPNAIADASHGDVACNHFEQWREDVDLITDMGVDAYRLSMAWPRVVDTNNQLNLDGLQFYIDVIEALKARGKQIFLTLYHWDLPQFLEDQGGWQSRQTAYDFAHYVEQVVLVLGNKVDAYITLNEPFCAGFLGYELGVHAPGVKSSLAGRKASHHLLLGHGLAMQKIRAICPEVEAGIVLNIHPGVPNSDLEADKKATQIATDYLFHWYLDPIVTGQYPALIKQLSEDILPDIHADDMAIIAQKVDFIGLNYYTRNVYAADGDWYKIVECNEFPKTEMGWEIVPHAFTDMLVTLNQQYDLPPLYITENGAAMPDQLIEGGVEDNDRIEYFQTHLDAMADAMAQGVDIKGYFAWSLMDNFEWAEGYRKRFGLVYIDYETQKRIPKKSASAYKDMLSSR